MLPFKYPWSWNSLPLSSSSPLYYHHSALHFSSLQDETGSHDTSRPSSFLASDSPDLPEILLPGDADGGEGVGGAGGGSNTRTGITPDLRAYPPPPYGMIILIGQGYRWLGLTITLCLTIYIELNTQGFTEENQFFFPSVSKSFNLWRLIFKKLMYSIEKFWNTFSGSRKFLSNILYDWK